MPVRAGWRRSAYGVDQFSTVNPGTAVRSLSALTTIVLPKLSAMAANEGLEGAFVTMPRRSEQPLIGLRLQEPDRNPGTHAGPERRGFSTELIEQLQTTFRLLTRSGLNTSKAIERIRTEVPKSPELEELIEFIHSSKRGYVK